MLPQTKLGEPNKAEAEAVDARQELDLKVLHSSLIRCIHDVQ